MGLASRKQGSGFNSRQGVYESPRPPSPAMGYLTPKAPDTGTRRADTLVYFRTLSSPKIEMGGKAILGIFRLCRAFFSNSPCRKPACLTNASRPIYSQSMYLPKTDKNSSMSMGFATWAFIPFFRAASLSSSMALAVMAMMGRVLTSSRGRERMVRVAS